MTDLIGEEKDYDGLFWEQEIFKETQSDDEYKTESEKGDKYDDDFYHEESSEGEAQEPKLEKKEKREALPEKQHKPQKKKKKLKIGKLPGVTQKEMLEQAAVVEMYNTYDLTKLMNLEASSKSSIVCHREKIVPTWRYTESYKTGKRKATIWHTEPLHNFVTGRPKKKICAVTGQPARYTDPLTGLNYANKEAFKKIRDDYYSQQEKIIQEHVKDLENILAQNYS